MLHLVVPNLLAPLAHRLDNFLHGQYFFQAENNVELAAGRPEPIACALLEGLFLGITRHTHNHAGAARSQVRGKPFNRPLRDLLARLAAIAVHHVRPRRRNKRWMRRNDVKLPALHGGVKIPAQTNHGTSV